MILLRCRNACTLLSIFLLFDWYARGDGFRTRGRVKKASAYLAPPSDRRLQMSDERLVPSTDSELNALLEQMPSSEKYSLLMQSYKTKIVEDRSNTANLIERMGALYYEMLTKAIKPDEQSTGCLIDASAQLCQVPLMSNAMRLIKIHGASKAFGAIVGQLTTPSMTKVGASGLMASETVPTDERESQIASATVIISLGLIWLVGQVLAGTVADDLHPWVTLYSVGVVLLSSLDIFFRQAAFIKTAISGIDRLVLKGIVQYTIH